MEIDSDPRNTKSFVRLLVGSSDWTLIFKTLRNQTRIHVSQYNTLVILEQSFYQELNNR